MTASTWGLSVRARFSTRSDGIQEENSETNRGKARQSVGLRFDADEPSYKHTQPHRIATLKQKIEDGEHGTTHPLVEAERVYPYFPSNHVFWSSLVTAIGLVLGLWMYWFASASSPLPRPKGQFSCGWLVLDSPPSSVADQNGEIQSRDCEAQNHSYIATDTSQEAETGRRLTTEMLPSMLRELDEDVLTNRNGGYRFVPPYLLPPPNTGSDSISYVATKGGSSLSWHPPEKEFFQVKRNSAPLHWELEWQSILARDPTAATRGPKIDYTKSIQYRYPPLPEDASFPPAPDLYPPLRPLGELLEAWNPNDDFPGTEIKEHLLHFDFTNATEMAIAERLRDAKLPFKVTNVPELLNANRKWTDEYLTKQFAKTPATLIDEQDNRVPSLSAAAHESRNQFFCYYNITKWDIYQYGLPPTRLNDWNYSRWARHAQYAQVTHLSPYMPHFYWQSGVHPLERHALDQSQWSFVSQDLPSFSSANATFFVFRPSHQKGIQCRFGERGVYAATHYDGGRNSVAMVTGAKRYILSPPRECPKLGIWSSRQSPLYRHSFLNYAHYSLLVDYKSNHTESSKVGWTTQEREWLKRAGQAQAVETVLKAGEVLYVPSHWFHTIVSLQKSAQCNVRAGIDAKGNPAFGNRDSVQKCAA